MFPSPGFLHANRTRVLRAASEAYQLFSPGPPVYGTQRDEPASHTVLNPFRRVVESLHPVRHHAAVDHCSWCRRTNSTGLTKGNDVSSATFMKTPEGSMNSKNSTDPGSSSATRSTPRHTTLSSHGFQLHAVPTSFRSHRRPDMVAFSGSSATNVNQER